MMSLFSSRPFGPWQFTCVLFCSVALAACGGGGSSSDDSGSSSSSSSSSSTSSSSSGSAVDVSPEAFGFTPMQDAEPGVEYVSEPVTISSIDVAVPVTVSGGGYAIGGGDCTSDEGQIEAGQTLELCGTAANELGGSTEVTVTVGEGANAQSATFTITALSDTTGPQAEIIFPPPMSATDQSTVYIRGTAQDDYHQVKSLHLIVNGAEAAPESVEADAGYANWTATVELAAGQKNVISVVATDSEGNITQSAAQVTVVRRDLELAFPEDGGDDFTGATSIAFDHAGKRVLVGDRSLSSDQPSGIIAVELGTSKRSIIVGDGVTPEISDDQRISFPYGTVLRGEDELFVTDYGEDYLYVVNLADRTREILEGPAGDVTMTGPTGIAFHPANPDLFYIAAEMSRNLVSYDAGSKEWATISDNNGDYVGPDFVAPANLSLLDENTAVVVDVSGYSVLRVDLLTGERRKIVTGEGDGILQYPVSVTVGKYPGHVFISDATEGVVSLEVEGGTWSKVTPKIWQGAYNYIHHWIDGRIIFLVSRESRALYAIDVGSGEIVLISKSAAD